MDRTELVKQAFIEAWEGYVAAIKIMRPDQETFNSLPSAEGLIIISPIAAQIYRQLSSVTYIKIPDEYQNEANIDMLTDMLEHSGVNYIIMPKSIETIPTEDEDNEVRE